MNSKALSIILFTGIALAQVSTQAQERINPFANPGYVATAKNGETMAPVEFILKAVMPTDNNPLANINGKILRVGDEFFGYELVSVSKASVQLKRDNNLIKLELRPTITSGRGGKKS